MSTVVLYDAQLMTRYYERRAQASINLISDFKLGQVVWGDGFEDTVDGQPSVATIPLDTAAIPDIFLTNDPIYTYANGRITIRAVLPAGSVAEGTQSKFTALGVLDDQGGLVAVLASTPIWINDKRSLVVEGYIDTNIA